MYYLFYCISDDSQSNGVYDITELTKHCILHAAMVLAPRGVKLPSGTHRIEQFCEDILNYIQTLVFLIYM